MWQRLAAGLKPVLSGMDSAKIEAKINIVFIDALGQVYW